MEEIIVENFPNMGKEIVNQVQEAQRVPYRIYPRRNMPRDIIIKLSKIKYRWEGDARGRGYEDIHMHIADSPCYKAETNTTS